MQAICFDFDGTLVDSEPVHYQAWQQTLAQWQVSLPLQTYLTQFSGTSTRATAAYFIDMYAIPLDEERLVAEKTAHYLQLLPDFLPEPMPGAAELLQSIAFLHLPMALVTGSRRHEIMPVLQKLEWQDYFSVIVTRDDVQNPKPHAEPYLRALEQLGITARDAVAVEDSSTGIQSARAAGMTVLAVQTPHVELMKDAGYHHLFTSLSAVGRYISMYNVP